MDIPPEVIAAKDALEQPLLQSGLITGIGFGLRDEDNPDPDDLVLRIFVADADAVPFEVQAALETFPFPAVIVQRSFGLTSVILPDTLPYRPVQGGCSVGASRFFSTGIIHEGTLGAVVQDASDPQIFYGLSNYHVLCVDTARQSADAIVQPEPTPFGVLPASRVGSLDRWAFPENTPSGTVEAAIFRIDPNVFSLPEIVDIGPVLGSIPATPGMQVTKRGRTTGQTFGIVTDIHFSTAVNFPALPAVGTPPSTFRTFTEQIQISADFPQSLVFGDSGDSGSLVVGGDNKAVGLYWGSGFDAPGNPLRFGIASPAAAVAQALNITF
jgi:hypothetical protein